MQAGSTRRELRGDVRDILGFWYFWGFVALGSTPSPVPSRSTKWLGTAGAGDGATKGRG